MPPNSQSSFPLRSYERTLSVPFVTISVRRSFSQMTGVAQLLPSFRSTFHTSLPVFASYAARNDCCSLSWTRYRRPLYSTGDAPVPQSFRILNGPMGFVQTGLPFMSNANRPMLPKYAYTRSPSVEGVSDA